MRRPELMLLQSLLAGDELSAQAVVDLARNAPAESEYHDFKSGKIVGGGRDVAGKLRWLAAGFANAEGGLLVIGVGDGTDAETGARVLEPSPRSADDTVNSLTNALRPLAAQLVPALRVQAVAYDGGALAVVAIPRSDQLVRAPSGGKKGAELAYPLRFGDSVHACPAWLAADLLVGKRARPRMVLANPVVEISRRYEPHGTADLSLTFVVRNDALRFADDARVAIVAGAPNGGIAPPEPRSEPLGGWQLAPPRLMERLRVVDRTAMWWGMRWIPLDLRTDSSIPPLTECGGRVSLLVPYPSPGQPFATVEPEYRRFPPSLKSERVDRYLSAGATMKHEWRAALFVFARDAEPACFALRVVYSNVEHVLSAELTPSVGPAPVGDRSGPFRGEW